MSGIYGIVRYDGAPVTREALAPVAAAMSFWGPDGHGQWCGDSAGLGHLMLRTTPESLHERQPAGIRAAPHLIITADARIDNRDELFDALGVPGPGRQETPDSSLILLSWERWGADCVRRLLGDFAFAIWDSRTRRLFCARDPFGCKPFVYYHSQKRFIFASDVKGVLAGLESPRLNEPLLAAHLQMKTYYAEKRLTFFEEIFKVEPAHLMILTERGLETTRYWSPEDAPEFRLTTDADYAAQMGFLFRQSVECRVRSAFPMGSHLSGGLDSSAVTIAASRLLGDRGRKLAVFSWSPPPDSANRAPPEGEYARIDAVCRQEGLSCDYTPATTASLIATFRRDFTVEPVAMMAREASVQAIAEARGLRVILSGWGGDDAVTCPAATSPAAFLLSGHWSDFRSAAMVGMGAVGSAVGLDAAGPAASRLRWARRLGGIVRDMVVPRLPDCLYGFTGANPFMAHRAPCTQRAFVRLYRREVKDLRVSAPRRLPGVRATICPLLEIGHITMRAEHWASSGARHGLVYRFPMLDKRLVEFALGVPPSPSPQTDRRRAIFRSAVSELLPPSADWDPVKREPATITALKTEVFQAYTEWAHHLASDKAVSPATRFVDPERIRIAIQSARKSGQLAALSGVHEAFGCYAIKY